MKIVKSLKTKLNGKMRTEEVWCEIEEAREEWRKKEEADKERWERLVPIADLFKF